MLDFIRFRVTFKSKKERLFSNMNMWINIFPQMLTSMIKQNICYTVIFYLLIRINIKQVLSPLHKHLRFSYNETEEVHIILEGSENNDAG